MRVAIYDRVEPSLPPQLPLRLTQTCSQREATVWLAFIVPFALAILLTAAAVFVETLILPEARAYLIDHPATGVSVLAGLGFLMFLLALPARRLVARLVTTRNVYIAEGMVHVLEGSRIRHWCWSEPLDKYLGVAAHVRTSLSGTRSELILVHPQRDKSVLLSVAPRTTQGEVARVAAMLGQHEIPAGALYRFRPLRTAAPMPSMAEPVHA